ncbi:MAG TPA: aldo/keto reductase [Candidatus Baltobacteraceae bacterium]|nr:aldo/keto reductase [Candidatus Baltobacteraceae bacterium]
MMDDYLQQPVLDAVARLKPIAAELEISMSQLALSWVLRQRAVTSAIVGATNPAHVRDNVAAGSLHLDDEIFIAMDRILEPILPREPYSA